MKGAVFGTPVFSTTKNLEGNEPPVSDLDRARAFWLLRRYTSLAYIERQAQLLSKLIEGFKAEAVRATDPYTMREFTQILAVLYRHEGSYRTGLKLLHGGKPSGYESILEGAKLASYFESRTFYEHEDLRWFAFGSENDRPLIGLLAWGRRTYLMAKSTQRTLQAEWTFQLLSDPRPALSQSVPPPHLDPAPDPLPHALQCSPGDIVPMSGVWLPIDRRFGCPNYLVSQWTAPAAMSTVALSENAAVDEGGYPDYTYERRVSRWELCWEDNRHGGSIAPDESEFLGEDVAFPDEPLRL